MSNKSIMDSITPYGKRCILKDYFFFFIDKKKYVVDKNNFIVGKEKRAKIIELSPDEILYFKNKGFKLYNKLHNNDDDEVLSESSSPFENY